jgi:hypothetical protein
MATLAKQFSSLEIKVELYASGTSSSLTSGFISLTGGISSVILEVDDTGASPPTYTVKVTVSGRPSVDVNSISIEMYCSAIEA